jgi:hypothetical protein
VGRRVEVVVGGTVQRVRSNGVTAERLDPPAVVVVYFTVARVFGACVRWGSVLSLGRSGRVRVNGLSKNQVKSPRNQARTCREEMRV